MREYGSSERMAHTMFGWLSPFRTSISPQTESSFPFTFFFGMTLRATSTLTPLLGSLLDFTIDKNEDVVVALVSLCWRDWLVGLEFLLLSPLVGGFETSGAAAAPICAMGTWPGGTCHVAFCSLAQAALQHNARAKHSPRLFRSFLFPIRHVSRSSSSCETMVVAGELSP
jgi:hypothetical protein